MKKQFGYLCLKQLVFSEFPANRYVKQFVTSKCVILLYEIATRYTLAVCSSGRTPAFADQKNWLVMASASMWISGKCLQPSSARVRPNRIDSLRAWANINCCLSASSPDQQTDAVV